MRLYLGQAPRAGMRLGTPGQSHLGTRGQLQPGHLDSRGWPWVGSQEQGGPSCHHPYQETVSGAGSLGPTMATLECPCTVAQRLSGH